MRKLILIISLILSRFLFASEVDNFTTFYEPLSDAVPRLNQMTNSMLTEAMNEANRESTECSQEVLAEKIDKYLGGAATWAKLELAINKDQDDGVQDYQTVWIHKSESVYKEWNLIEAPSLFIDQLTATTSPAVQIGDIQVGTDKIGHFLGVGYLYYKTYLASLRQNRSEQEAIDNALLFGEFAEKSYFGYVATGVYSFSDLVANFEGFQFYLNLEKAYQGKTALFRCNSSNQWEVNRDFDWHDYINDAWNEAINCSFFRTSTMGQKVDQQVSALESRYGKKFHCPIRVNQVDALVSKYGDYTPRLLHLDYLKNNKLYAQLRFDVSNIAFTASSKRWWMVPTQHEVKAQLNMSKEQLKMVQSVTYRVVEDEDSSDLEIISSSDRVGYFAISEIVDDAPSIIYATIHLINGQKINHWISL